MPAADPYLTPAQAQALAQSLMREHGLTARGWQFEWSRGKRRLGETIIRQTRPRKSVPRNSDPRKSNPRKTGKVVTVKAIRLSKYLVEHNGESVVRDVILHEIAHALAGLEHGHDAVWRAMCEKVGAKPQRLADESVQVVEGRYALVCTACSQELARRHRRTAPEKLANSYCRDCGPKSMGKLKVVKALIPQARAGHCNAKRAELPDVPKPDDPPHRQARHQSRPGVLGLPQLPQLPRDTVDVRCLGLVAGV